MLIWLAGWAMAGLGLVGYVLWALNGAFVRQGNWIGVDFHTYYQVAQALRRGADIYRVGVSPPYVYPPLLALLVVPLTFLSATWATILWKLFQHICLLAAGGLLVNLLPGRVRPLAAGLLMLGLFTMPLRDEIQLGESNSLILLLIAGTLWLAAKAGKQGENNNEWPPALLWAGVLLALAVSIKVLPALLVAYFWWRGPRVAAVATAGFLIVQGLLFVVTPATATYWFSVFPGLFGQPFPYADNQSFNAFFSRAFLPPDPNLPAMQVAAGEPVRLALTWAANLAALLGAAWVLWAYGRRLSASLPSNTGWLLEAGLVLLTIHLVSGSTWVHHLIDLAVPMLGLLGAWWLSGRSKLGAGLLGAGFAIILLVLARSPADWAFSAHVLAPNSSLLALLASAMPMWVVIGLWAAVAATLLAHVTPTTDRV